MQADWQGNERDAQQAARLAALYDLDCAPLEGYADVDWFEGLARRTAPSSPDSSYQTR